MNAADRDRLVAAYVKDFTRNYVWDRDMVLRELSGERAGASWASETFDEISRTDPELCWELILQVLHAPHAEAVTAVLAAGPLEDLLTRFGPRFIERVEAKAKDDPDFKDLLGGVWRNAMTDEVWARVEACRGQPW